MKDVEYEWEVHTEGYFADQPIRVEAIVDGQGLVVKESIVVKPGLLENGDNLPTFPGEIYFPRE